MRHHAVARGQPVSYQWRDCAIFRPAEHEHRAANIAARYAGAAEGKLARGAARLGYAARAKLAR